MEEKSFSAINYTAARTPQKVPEEDAATRTKQILSDVTSAQQRLKVTANQIAHLPVPVFFFS